MSSSTWAGGNIPTQAEFADTVTININHAVNYDRGTPLKNRGVFRVERLPGGSPVRLDIPTNINFDNLTGAELYIINATFVQCRFVGCNNGQPYNGSDPTAVKQNGTVKNEGGYVEVRGSYVEVAQDWESTSNGTRLMVDSCVFTGQDFAVLGSSTETLIRTSVSIGWHGSGNFQVAASTISFNDVLVQLAGTSGNLQMDSASKAGGDIDYITFNNQFGGFTGTGEIFLDPDLKNLSGQDVLNIIDLDAYCISSPSKYKPNGKIFGNQTPICDGRFGCGLLTPSAAPASISGRVMDGRGRGISRVFITVEGGTLGSPKTVVTNPFGYYKIDDLEVGDLYILSAASKRYSFVEPTVVVSLQENLAGINFVASDPAQTVKPPKIDFMQRLMKIF